MASWRSAVGSVLLSPALLLAAAAFLLAARAVADGDVWWHLRAGEWVLEHRRPPDLDPFTFGSETERWVDLHWLFQVALALVHRGGGVGGVVAFTAVLAAAAVAAAWAAGRGARPGTVVLLVWVPAVVLMSERFRPRPEMLTLLFLAVFLAVLVRVPGRPRLAWLLPPVQLVWVNTHGLFVFGPVVLACWMAEQGGGDAWRYYRTGRRPDAGRRAWWAHVGGAAVAVGLACLCNPYGLAGATFPLTLFPKVAQHDNLYKQHVAEFAGLSAAYPTLAAGGPVYAYVLFSLHFLLLLLPLSFLLPALWRAAHPAAADPAGVRPVVRPSPGTALRVFTGLVLLSALNALAPLLPARDWLATAGGAVPWVLAAAGAGAGVYLRDRGREAVGLAVTGFVGLGAYALWVQGELTGAPAPAAGVLAAGMGVVAGGLVLRRGGSLFALLLAVAFGYLAFAAVNGLARFGLVAGVVIGWNLGPWAAGLAGAPRPGGDRVWLAARAGLGAVVAVWVAAAAAGRLTGWVGPVPPVVFGELPDKFAHDAARFAGADGMPPRALVFDLQQAAVYEYHNGPARKPYIDPRLEVPTPATFANYVSIERMLGGQDPRWADAVRDLGNPLVLVSYRSPDAQAAVLTHPGWRLAYLDRTAGVFLPRGDPALEARFPTLDLAARHFARAAAQPAYGAGGREREASALASLGLALARSPGAAWDVPAPVLLAALDAAGPLLRDAVAPPDLLLQLGFCHLTLRASHGKAPPAPADGWDPVAGVPWAAATYALRLARTRAGASSRPYDLALYAHYGARRMTDAQAAVGRRILETGRLPPDAAAPVGRLVRAVESLPDPAGDPTPDLPTLVLRLLGDGRPEAAARLATAAAPGGGRWRWDVADALAGAWMHLGEPARARAVWEAAAGPPSEAVRLGRVGATYWVEGDLDAAVRTYDRARDLDAGLLDPHWSLAWVYAQQGRADLAHPACRRALDLLPPGPPRAELERLERLLRRFAEPAGG